MADAPRLALSFQTSLCGPLRSPPLHRSTWLCQGPSLQCSLGCAVTSRLCLCTTPLTAMSVPAGDPHADTSSSEVPTALCSPPEPGPTPLLQRTKCKLLSVQPPRRPHSAKADSFIQTLVLDFMERSTPGTVAYQVPPSMGFSRQEYWSGLPFPSLGDLPDPGIESRDRTWVSRIGGRRFNLWASREPNQAIHSIFSKLQGVMVKYF